MMMKLINNTKKCIRCFARLNGLWFDGILPGETVEVDEPYKVTALLKHGCEVVKKSVAKKVVEHKSLEDVLAEKPKRKYKKRVE